MIYWFWMGILYLCYLTYQDYKDKMMVDDRYNYFMMGATTGLIFFYHNKWFFVLILIGMIIGLSLFMKRFKLMGEADIKTFMWSFTGFAIINYWYAVYYMATFILIYFLHSALRLWVFKRKEKAQGYPVLLISYVLMGIVLL